MMEVELGLKITRTRDDTTSVSDFQFAKDKSGPVFLSKESDAALILIAHLRGYQKEKIEININKDGSELSVSGEKEVREMQMIPFKKEFNIKEFVKKFRIPKEVVLDEIKAKFNKEDGVLTIVMPKREVEKRMSGNEEVEEKEEEEKRVGENEDVADSIVTPEPEPEPEPKKVTEETSPVKKPGPTKPWTPCPPLLFGGSTLLATLIFLVIHFIRPRNS
ncbi:17.6 kDa class I heat shock protein 1, partial [Mucuna pruriens]